MDQSLQKLWNIAQCSTISFGGEMGKKCEQKNRKKNINPNDKLWKLWIDVEYNDDDDDEGEQKNESKPTLTKTTRYCKVHSEKETPMHSK